jgi:hypothetical protein
MSELQHAVGTALPDGESVFEAPITIRKMLTNAGALLSSLSAEQQTRITFAMDDPRRLDCDFVPKPDRNGVPLWELDKHQRTLAHVLLASGLSTRGYTQALAIMAMENILREGEVGRIGISTGDFRHGDGYFLSFYGRPGLEDTWGWRMLGHHLSISYTIIEQRYLCVTPSNMGAQPAQAGVLAPLGAEETVAFALLRSLASDQHGVAVIHDVAPADFATRQVPYLGDVEYPDYYDLGLPHYRITEADREALKFVRDRPAGIAGSMLGADQLNLLRTLVGCYVGRVPDEVADRQLRRIEHHGIERLHFAWAGGEREGTPHYYRIQGGDFLVEFDNALDGGNHIHSVWRDLDDDLGHSQLIDHAERELAFGHHLATRLQSSVPRGSFAEAAAIEPANGQRGEPSQGAGRP